MTQTESIRGRADLQNVFKAAPALRSGAARFAIGRLWLSSPGQSVLRTKGKCRRPQLCYPIDLHFMCLGELRNSGTEVEHGKTGFHGDHGRAGGFETDAIIKLKAQQPHD